MLLPSRRDLQRCNVEVSLASRFKLNSSAANGCMTFFVEQHGFRHVNVDSNDGGFVMTDAACDNMLSVKNVIIIGMFMLFLYEDLW
jgi:hypothetical protein